MPQRRVEHAGRSRTRCRPRRRSSATRLGRQVEPRRRAPRAGRPTPQADDAARLPCLTTRAPAPATTSAAIVEMLTVWARSPPVPTMSTRARAPRSRTRVRRASRDQPATSSTVSPLARSATTKPAICAGVASPAMTCAHRPGGLAGRQVCAGEQSPSSAGPGRAARSRRPGGQRSTAGTRRQALPHAGRRRPWRPRSGRAGGHHGVGPRPGGQPARPAGARSAPAPAGSR